MKFKRLPALVGLSFALFGFKGQASLLINEVDYDQPGSDTAEFIELFNAGSTSLDLFGYSLSLINGNSGAIYRSFDLPDLQLQAGAYFVLCGDSANVINCDLNVSPASNLIQNGAPDALALFFGASQIDSLSYEGSVAGFTEGSGAGLVDSSTVAYLGLSRWPNGADSDSNNADFAQACITPGMANTDRASGCTDPVVVPPIGVPEPAAWLLLGAGLVLLRGRRGRCLHGTDGLRTTVGHEPKRRL